MICQRRENGSLSTNCTKYTLLYHFIQFISHAPQTLLKLTKCHACPRSQSRLTPQAHKSLTTTTTTIWSENPSWDTNTSPEGQSTLDLVKSCHEGISWVTCSIWGCGNMELFPFWGIFYYFISSTRHDICLWNQAQVIKRSWLCYFSWFLGFFKGLAKSWGFPTLEPPKYWNLFVESCSEKSFVHVFTVFGCLWQCLKFGQEIYRLFVRNCIFSVSELYLRNGLCPLGSRTLSVRQAKIQQS